MAFTATGVYDAIFEFTNNAAPLDKWRTTLTYIQTIVPSPTDAFIIAIEGVWKAFVHPDVTLSTITVYNWSRGALIYPAGSPIFTKTTNVVGTADTNWPHLAPLYSPNGGEVCLRMDHEPTTGGKPGRSFLRALLGEDDVSAQSGGRWILNPTLANLQSDLNGILTGGGLMPYFGAGLGGTIIGIQRFSKKHSVVGPFVPCTGFTLIGVTTNKLTRKNKK
jgi:hypothetical protein